MGRFWRRVVPPLPPPAALAEPRMLTRPLRSLRRVRYGVLAWIEDRNLARPLDNIVFFVLVGVLGATITVALAVGGSEYSARDSDPLRDQHEAESVERRRQGPIEYVNQARGYGFAYPRTWDRHETERVTRITSPDGGIIVSFGLGSPGDLATASSRLLRSLTGLSDREQIGVRREAIGGFRSLLVSGIATDESGRSVRFLAISIQGESRNYAISIVVPRESDPAEVLPRLEEIVSSFEILGGDAQVVI